MIAKEIFVNNKSGLEAKQAAMFIQKASSFNSNIWIESDDRKANAKSLLGLLSLGIAGGQKVVLRAEGNDEETAIDQLVVYFNIDDEENMSEGNAPIDKR